MRMSPYVDPRELFHLCAAPRRWNRQTGGSCSTPVQSRQARESGQPARQQGLRPLRSSFNSLPRCAVSPTVPHAQKARTPRLERGQEFAQCQPRWGPATHLPHTPYRPPPRLGTGGRFDSHGDGAFAHGVRDDFFYAERVAKGNGSDLALGGSRQSRLCRIRKCPGTARKFSSGCLATPLLHRCIAPPGPFDPGRASGSRRQAGRDNNVKSIVLGKRGRCVASFLSTQSTGFQTAHRCSPSLA